MSNGSNIRVVGPDSEPQAHADSAEAHSEEVFSLEKEWVEDAEEEATSTRNTAWIVPALAALVITVWTAFYAWVHQSQMLSGGTPQQWSEWVIAWSIPVLLVVAIWMLATRTSTREAARFGEVARAMSDESAALEVRLSVINRELSIARDFLGSQSRELESLGRAAGERLSGHADHLQSLIHNNGVQVEAIATVSTTALENMVRLRDDLPVIANSARDLTNNIGNAGRTAHGQIEELVAGFQRLNDFGQASERQVSSLQVSIDAALAGFESKAAQIDTVTNARFNALQATSDEFRADLDVREVEALAALRRRADTLADELAGSQSALEEQEEATLVSLRTRLMSLRDESKTIGQSVRDGEGRAIAAWNGQIEDIQARLESAIEQVSALDEAALTASRAKLQELTEEAERVDLVMAERGEALRDQIAARSSQMSQDEQEAIETLSARLAQLDEAIGARRAQQIEQSEKLSEHGDKLAERFAALGTNLETMAALERDTETALALGADELNEKLGQNRQKVEETTAAIAVLTEDTVRLLELIQASSKHSHEILPAAIDQASDQITAAEDQVNRINLLLGQASTKGAELSEYVLGAKAGGQDAAEHIEQFHLRMTAANTEHRLEVNRLESSLGDLTAHSTRLSEKARTELRDAITFLKQSSREALGEITSGTAANISEVAKQIAEQSSSAIDQALRDRTIDAVAELEAAATKAAGAGRNAASNLRDQLGKVDELTSNLEARVSRARERAEEQIDHDFSRRVALITESLNSNAIDISKALSNEVTDTAWASYLRGDRGIFTRRAVKLLDNTEARDIAEVYAADGEFAENVSRYIHDFEAMLRVMLSTRDGNALGVTLLSSDMGKLYVALAQAIERLRT
jgi:chromosome segregation ATPase